MAHDLSFTAELESKMKQYQAQLEDLNDKLSKLTSDRDALMQGYNACRTLLEMETQGPEINKNHSDNKTLPIFEDLPNFAELSIPAAAAVILRDSRRPLSNSELVREIRRRGKGMEGPNSYNILYSSLKRNPNIFKKQGSLWTLVKKSQETEAA